MIVIGGRITYRLIFVADGKRNAKVYYVYRYNEGISSNCSFSCAPVDELDDPEKERYEKFKKYGANYIFNILQFKQYCVDYGNVPFEITEAVEDSLMYNYDIDNNIVCFY